MLKAGGEDIADALTETFKDMRETEVIPDIWKTALIVRLPKKGGLGLCNNWSGVALLSSTC